MTNEAARLVAFGTLIVVGEGTYAVIGSAEMAGDVMLSTDAGDFNASVCERLIKIEKCRSCGAKIVWLKTAKGKSNPVEAETVRAEDYVNHQPPLYTHGLHISHFVTCKDSKQWKKSK